MLRIVALGFAVAWGLDTAASDPSVQCIQGSAEYQDQLGIDLDSDGCLLQVHRSQREAVKGNDCPGKMSWATAEAALNGGFKSLTGPASGYYTGLPVYTQGTFSNFNTGFGDCAVSMDGSVTLELDGVGISSSVDCHSPDCSLPERVVENRYIDACNYSSSLNLTLGISADALDIKASFSDGKLTFGPSCPVGAGPIDLKDVVISFTLEHVTLAATGFVEASFVGWKGAWTTPVPDSAIFNLDPIDLNYTKVDKLECTRNGEPWKDCIDDATVVFKNGLLEQMLRASSLWDSLSRANIPTPWYQLPFYKPIEAYWQAEAAYWWSFWRRPWWEHIRGQ